MRLLETLTERGTWKPWTAWCGRPATTPEAALSPIEREIAREIEGSSVTGGLKPPDLDTVLKRDRRRKTLYITWSKTGALVPATERTSNRTVVFHQAALAGPSAVLQKRSGGRRRADAFPN